MENRAVEKAKRRYEELFPTKESKANAFDKLAEKYYYANFGTTPKTDVDVLMFSIYLEQILNVSESDMSSYSDYALSKLLGITQSRISNLKVKKELQYPYENFSWEKSFARIIDNYRYENGKIKLHIPDKNLYYEIKNIIENAGGYVDVQLNTTLLQINPEYFVDLIVAITEDDNRVEIKKKLKKTLDEHKVSTDDFDRKSIGELLKESAPDAVSSIVGELIGECIPAVGPVVGAVLKRIIKEFPRKDHAMQLSLQK